MWQSWSRRALGKRINMFRKHQRLTVAALAELAKLSEVVVTAAIQGHEKVAERDLTAICTALGLNPKSIFASAPVGRAAALLRSRRIAAKLTCNELARRADLSEATVRQLESARLVFNRSSVLRLLAVQELGLKWEDFAGLDLGSHPKEIPMAETPTLELGVVAPIPELVGVANLWMCQRCLGRGVVRSQRRRWSLFQRWEGRRRGRRTR